ncbi:MAG: carboxymuconolactone decarboxylase family protein [Planctomycetota bacterium]|nr:MAG: carboxymuconolactone decarboxylase family protein [Planctomycetota bacterium]
MAPASDRVPPPPKRYREIAARFPEVTGAYEALQRATAAAGPLSGRERELVKFGLAVGAGLDSSARAHVRKGAAFGLTRSEFEQAALLAATTCGWSRAVMALGWVERAFASERREGA